MVEVTRNFKWTETSGSEVRPDTYLHPHILDSGEVLGVTGHGAGRVDTVGYNVMGIEFTLSSGIPDAAALWAIRGTLDGVHWTTVIPQFGGGSVEVLTGHVYEIPVSRFLAVEPIITASDDGPDPALYRYNVSMR